MIGTLDPAEFAVLSALEERFRLSGGRCEEVRRRSGAPCCADPVREALEDRGLVRDGVIADAGFEALEPYRVKRAVLLAAGFGARLVPVTLETPKPLVRVCGRRIIDTLLDAVYAAGIDEVHVVRGYLAEQFDQLLDAYPDVRFIENPLYGEANNISSALAAKDLLGGAYVFESDLLLSNPGLVTRYQYASNYLGVPVDVTDDWCFTTRDGFITGMKVGGERCHHMFGLSYWTEADGEKLARDIPEVFALPGGADRFWDVVPLEVCADRYDVRIRECTFEDIVEIDTFAELQELDPSYRPSHRR